jgi:hypothetical protein
MKVPTYHKFGLKKSQVLKSDARDKKVSDILTHHLTIIIGSVLGILIYIIYYNEVKPSTFIQIVMQVFLFASMGVLCVGIPAVLFKLAEIFYFRQIKEKTTEHKTMQKYLKERDEFDFWKIRRDYSFWNILDGLSFEKEIMNMYMHLGYGIKEEMNSDEELNDRIIFKDDKCWYLFFNTKAAEISEIELIDKLLLSLEESKCLELIIFSQKGFNRKVIDHAKDKPVLLYDINGIIKVARTVTINKPGINEEETKQEEVKS